MTRTRFSKPAQDIALEFDTMMKQEADLIAMVRRMNKRLSDCPKRSHCLMCHAGLGDKDIIDHRDVPFFVCGTCGHIQSGHQPDAAFDREVTETMGYELIYPALDRPAYISSCERIYRPKAEWTVSELKAAGMSKPAQEMRWVEIGCGAGGYLYSLREMGCHDIIGFERDRHNIRNAQEALGEDLVVFSEASVAEAIRDNDADIYASFFVMEHVDDPLDVAKALAEKPVGTAFVFSVPVFGFATIFESMVEDHYPRSLDAMVHTQIYTEHSIDYFLKTAGYEKAAQWVFGQDSMDFFRFAAVHLKNRYPEILYKEVMGTLAGMIDPMQQAFDRAGFADSRHILAIKR